MHYDLSPNTTHSLIPNLGSGSVGTAVVGVEFGHCSSTRLSRSGSYPHTRDFGTYQFYRPSMGVVLRRATCVYLL